MRVWFMEMLSHYVCKKDDILNHISQTQWDIFHCFSNLELNFASMVRPQVVSAL